LYVVDSGCKWRQLPHDFPKWQTVYSFFRRSIEKKFMGQDFGEIGKGDA